MTSEFVSAVAHWPPATSWLPRIWVYAYLGVEDEILYIGQTKDLMTRNWAHGTRSAWFPLVEGFALISPHHNRRHALDAEAAAIRLYAPRFNVVHNRTHRIAS